MVWRLDAVLGRSVLSGVCVCLSACGPGMPLTKPTPAQLCGAESTAEGLKGELFRSSVGRAPGSLRRQLERYRVVIDGAVLDDYNPTTGRATCRANLYLATRDGARRVPLDLSGQGLMRYSRQPLADGSGIKYELPAMDLLALAELVILVEGATAPAASAEEPEDLVPNAKQMAVGTPEEEAAYEAGKLPEN